MVTIFTVDQENKWYTGDSFISWLNGNQSKYTWHKDYAIGGEEKSEQNRRYEPLSIVEAKENIHKILKNKFKHKPINIISHKRGKKKEIKITYEDEQKMVADLIKTVTYSE